MKLRSNTHGCELTIKHLNSSTIDYHIILTNKHSIAVNLLISGKNVERVFLDKNGLTNIYRHNRSPKTLFLEFLFFFIFEGTLRP